jgi:hypothetical protein
MARLVIGHAPDRRPRVPALRPVGFRDVRWASGNEWSLGCARDDGVGVLRSPLPIAHCPLPIAHCPLPLAPCPLPLAPCPLPLAYSLSASRN